MLPFLSASAYRGHSNNELAKSTKKKHLCNLKQFQQNNTITMKLDIEIVQFFNSGLQEDILLFIGSNRTLRAIAAINEKLKDWGYESLQYDIEENGVDEMKLSACYQKVKEELEFTGKEILWNETEVEDNTNEVEEAFEDILEAIQDNTIGAWQSDLGTTSDAVILEDFQEVHDPEDLVDRDDDGIIKYNNWHGQLTELKDRLCHQ